MAILLRLGKMMKTDVAILRMRNRAVNTAESRLKTSLIWVVSVATGGIQITE